MKVASEDQPEVRVRSISIWKRVRLGPVVVPTLREFDDVLKNGRQTDDRKA